MAAAATADRELAATLGEAFATPGRFAEELARPGNDPDVVADLLFVSGHLMLLRGQELRDFVREVVWAAPIRIAFFLQAPYEKLLLRMVSDPKTEMAALPVITESLARGAHVERAACSLIPTLSQSLRWASHAETAHILSLLVVFANSPSTHAMLLDDTLFASLSDRTQGDAVPLVATFARVLGPWLFERDEEHFSLPLVEALGRHLGRELLRHNDVRVAPLDECLTVLEECSRHAHWHAALVPLVLTLGRHGWRFEFARLVEHLLRGASVEFVMRLHDTNRLSLLVRSAHAAKDASEAWKRVFRRLYQVWPSKVAEVLNLPPPSFEPKTIECTCPITLEGCHRPVVASDGHTYECDALVKHMSLRGPVSPMTKEPLEYLLYDNRVVS